jgi:putative transposase
MCRVLGVSPSGYYAWRHRGPSAHTRKDIELTQKIRLYHQASRGTYGAPRIHADLADEGIRVGRKRVARLMRAAGLQGISRRKGPRTTVRDAQTRPALDLVNRDFTAVAPKRLWVADITHVSTLVGVLYLAVGSMSSAAVSWGGQWPIICVWSWYWMR